LSTILQHTPIKRVTDERPVDPLIEMVGVIKTYGQGGSTIQALYGIDLLIKAREFVAIMGPSGSGTPSSGVYKFRGVPVHLLSRDARALLRRHFLGFVFQGFNLLARTTAQENVELPLVYQGQPSFQRKEAARKALAMVGLAGWERHTPAELSGGQQQRVAIARALVTEPVVLLADEPTGNLDSHHGREIMEFIQSLNRERGITVLIVTHDPNVAAFADRMVHFVDGQIESDTQARG
jgi:putative ABC transport system ATP-binding protein